VSTLTTYIAAIAYGEFPDRPRLPETFTFSRICKQIMKIKSNDTLLHDLLELVAALDRRVPRLEREGEHDIARDAQGLRRAALKRIAELERSLPARSVGAGARNSA
jgi:hypothetical protein